MNLLFDSVNFGGRSLTWTHHNKTDTDFPGYYHWHPCSEILFVHEGRGSVILNQRTFEIKRGRLFFFQPFQLHKVYAEVAPGSPYARTILHFDTSILLEQLQGFPSRQRAFRDLLQKPGIMQVYDLEAETGHLEKVLEAYARTCPPGQEKSQEEVTLDVAGTTLRGGLHPGTNRVGDASVEVICLPRIPPGDGWQPVRLLVVVGTTPLQYRKGG